MTTLLFSNYTEPPCQSQKSQVITIPGQSGKCESLTIVVGTGGPHQTIITNNQLETGGKAPTQNLPERVAGMYS